MIDGPKVVAAHGGHKGTAITQVSTRSSPVSPLTTSLESGQSCVFQSSLLSSSAWRSPGISLASGASDVRTVVPQAIAVDLQGMIGGDSQLELIGTNEDLVGYVELAVTTTALRKTASVPRKVARKSRG